MAFYTLKSVSYRPFTVKISSLTSLIEMLPRCKPILANLRQKYCSILIKRRSLLFDSVFHRYRLAMIARIMIRAIGSQKGDKTHSQDHAIKPVSLSTINTIVKRPQKPMPPVDDVELDMLDSCCKLNSIRIVYDSPLMSTIKLF